MGGAKKKPGTERVLVGTRLEIRVCGPENERWAEMFAYFRSREIPCKIDLSVSHVSSDSDH